MKKLKNLKAVSIGPYVPEAPVILNDKPGSGTNEGDIYDEKMGIIFKSDWTKGSNDYAKAFGRNGIIPLDYHIIIPVFETYIKKLLRLFKLDMNGERLVPIPYDISLYINKHSDKKGYYKFLAITKDAKKGDWNTQKKNDDSYRGGLLYGSKHTIVVSGSQVKDILEQIETLYPDMLEGLGFDLSISRPSQYVVNYVPVIQNILRKPMIRSKGQDQPKYITTQYKAISKNKDSPSKVWEHWEELILSKDDDGSLEKSFFNSGKKGGPRGKGLSKVGGQIARSVICPDPEIRPDQVGLPRAMAKNISYRLDVTEENIDEINRLLENGDITHVFNTGSEGIMNVKSDYSIKLIPGKMQVLRRLQDGDIVILNRQPTLHKFSLMAFEVYLHDESCIYIHPSITKPFGADFDGDEFNVNVPYTKLGLNEAKNLMFVTYNMAASASSALLVGYFQDITLAAHYISLPGTYVTEEQWDELAFISFNNFWFSGSYHAPLVSQTFDLYDDWKSWHIERCTAKGIDYRSGRGLYSTILDQTFNFKNSSITIIDGIFVDGVMNGKNTTNSADSIGLQMYHTHGPKKTMAWLNISYLMLNQFLIKKGVTLSYQDVKPSESKQSEIDKILSQALKSKSLTIDPELEVKSKRARLENEITEELNSIRDIVKDIIVNDVEEIELQPTSSVELFRTDGEKEVVDAKLVKSNFYLGSLYLDDKFYPMDVYHRVKFMTVDGEFDRTRTIDNLKLMTRSGARGNETNIVQIAGIIGQQTSGGERVERSLPYGNLPHGEFSGKRSLCTYRFGENSPESRGFISTSYAVGMGSSISNYFNLHWASRFAMSANHTATPVIGYFERKIKTYNENYKIAKIGNKLVVNDEFDNIIMWTYLLDPLKLFKIPECNTFTDIKFEMRQMNDISASNILVLKIKLLKHLNAYKHDNANLIKYISESDDDLIILSVNTLLISYHPDYYEYLHDVIPSQFPDKRFLLLSGDIDLNDMNYSMIKFIQVSPSFVTIPKLGDEDSIIISSTAYNYPDIMDDFSLASSNYNDLSFVSRNKNPLLGKMKKV